MPKNSHKTVLSKDITIRDLLNQAADKLQMVKSFANKTELMLILLKILKLEEILSKDTTTRDLPKQAADKLQMVKSFANKTKKMLISYTQEKDTSRKIMETTRKAAI
jgi:hypothetical protein